MTADKYVVMFKFGASTASIVFASNAFRAEVAVMEERWNALRKETGAA